MMMKENKKNKEKKNKNKETSMEMLRKFQFLVVVLGWRSGSAVCADPRREDLPPNRHVQCFVRLCYEPDSAPSHRCPVHSWGVH